MFQIGQCATGSAPNETITFSFLPCFCFDSCQCLFIFNYLNIDGWDVSFLSPLVNEEQNDRFQPDISLLTFCLCAFAVLVLGCPSNRENGEFKTIDFGWDCILCVCNNEERKKKDKRRKKKFNRNQHCSQSWLFTSQLSVNIKKKEKKERKNKNEKLG